jgi:hypothetical protein
MILGRDVEGSSGLFDLVIDSIANDIAVEAGFANLVPDVFLCGE